MGMWVRESFLPALDPTEKILGWQSRRFNHIIQIGDMDLANISSHNSFIHKLYCCPIRQLEIAQ